MSDTVERMFAPGVEWAGDIMESMGLPRDGNCRVLMKPNGEWTICDSGRWPETIGETVGGPTIIDPTNRELRLAGRILKEMRRYAHCRDTGNNEHAAYTVARLGELVAEVPIQNARSRGGKEGAESKRNAISERNRRIREAAAQLYKEGHQEKAVVSILNERFKRDDGTKRADEFLSIRQIRRILKGQ